MNKKKLLLGITIMMVIGWVLPLGVARAEDDNTTQLFSGGTGDENTPYLISSADDLKNLADMVNGSDSASGIDTDTSIDDNTFSGKYFEQTCDIDITNFTPIGNSETNCFSGNYDGGENTISGSIQGTENYVGLFGYVESDDITPTISDLTVDCSIKGTVTSESGNSYYIGGIVGTNKGTIENCKFSGSIDFSGSTGIHIYTGGIVGFNFGGTITECSNSGNITGVNNVGGIVGLNQGTLTNCVNEGEVTGTSDVGGIVGSTSGTTSRSITGCYNTGTISGNEDVGGIVGEECGICTVEQCYNTGTITGTTNVGGLVGNKNSAASINECYNTGTISGTTNTGGIVGTAQVTQGSINNCYYSNESVSNLTNITEEGTALPLSQMVGTSALNNMIGFTNTIWNAIDTYSPVLINNEQIYPEVTPSTPSTSTPSTSTPSTPSSYTVYTDGVAQTVTYGGKAVAPATPVKEGYTFVNWLREDGSIYDFNQAVYGNITLISSWNENVYMEIIPVLEEQIIEENGTEESNTDQEDDFTTQPQTIEHGVAGQSATYHINVDLDKFVRLYIEGELVPEDCYDVTEGSTIITLHEDYMATLSVGTYDMIAEFTTGNANLVLTITEAVVEEMIKEEAENGIDNAQVDDTTTEEGQDGSGEAVEQGSNVWMILVGILVVAGIGGFLFFIGKKRKKEEEV